MFKHRGPHFQKACSYCVKMGSSQNPRLETPWRSQSPDRHLNFMAQVHLKHCKCRKEIWMLTVANNAKRGMCIYKYSLDVKEASCGYVNCCLFRHYGMVFRACLKICNKAVCRIYQWYCSLWLELPITIVLFHSTQIISLLNSSISLCSDLP